MRAIRTTQKNRGAQLEERPRIGLATQDPIQFGQLVTYLVVISPSRSLAWDRRLRTQEFS